MRYVENLSNDPCYNLAFEECLFRKAERENRAFASLWINGPSIIIGRFQNARGEVNQAEAESRNILVVRRITGGGAVYHDFGNLNYTFIIPRSEETRLDFADFAEPIVAALHSLGVEAQVSGRNDILSRENGGKISGTAQHASKAAILHHGTILFDADLDAMQKVLNADPSKFQSKGCASIRARVTNIRSLMASPPSIGEFRQKIREYLNIPDEAAAPQELEEAEKLARQKYRTWEWNWGESPDFTERRESRFPWGKMEAMLDVREGVIQTCRIFGDYFGEGADAVEAALQGVPYRGNAMRDALRVLPLARYFAGARPDEVLSFFCG